LRDGNGFAGGKHADRAGVSPCLQRPPRPPLIGPREAIPRESVEAARGTTLVTPSPAATDLACLIEREMGYEHGQIDPIKLGRFIQDYWTRVAAFAHAIHGGG
jgi:hypothetical protein